MEFLNNIQQEIEKLISEETAKLTNDLDRTNKELTEAKKKIKKLQAELEEAKAKNNSKDLLEKLINNSGEIDIHRFMETFFNKTYKTDTSGVDTWLAILTEYYKDKDAAIEIMKMFKIKMPYNVKAFKLPVDWGKEEVLMFVKGMYWNVNCNNCQYDGNLRFWQPNALKNVEDIYYGANFSEVPWQFILRNPHIKDHLNMCAEKCCVHSNWDKMYKIDLYQELTDDEIKKLLNINISNIKSHLILKFMYRHLDCMTDKQLKALYDKEGITYSIMTNINAFPFECIKDFISKRKLDGFRHVNLDSFSDDEVEILTKIALGR